MATAGTRVLREDGTIGLLSDGSIALHPAEGVCDECCGAPPPDTIPCWICTGGPKWYCATRYAEDGCEEGETQGQGTACPIGTTLCSCEGQEWYFDVESTISDFLVQGSCQSRCWRGSTYPHHSPPNCKCGNVFSEDDWVKICDEIVDIDSIFLTGSSIYVSYSYWVSNYTTDPKYKCSVYNGRYESPKDTRIAYYSVNHYVDKCNCRVNVVVEVTSLSSTGQVTKTYTRWYTYSELDTNGGIVEMNMEFVYEADENATWVCCGIQGQENCLYGDTDCLLHITARLVISLGYLVDAPGIEKCDGFIDAFDECESDSDCEELYADDPGTWECVNGTCVQVCETSEDCTEGYHCEDGECVPDCFDDDDCEEGYGCEGGVCVQTCGDNIDCPAGQICVDGESHQYCADGDRPCSVDEECSGWECVDEVCQPPEE